MCVPLKFLMEKQLPTIYIYMNPFVSGVFLTTDAQDTLTAPHFESSECSLNPSLCRSLEMFELDDMTHSFMQLAHL
jgi:hypothetical protein